MGNQDTIYIMPHIGIDYGTKKTGLAVSGADDTIAFPKAVVPTAELEGALRSLVDEYQPTGFVVGQSDSGTDTSNSVSAEISSFVNVLKETFELPVALQNEYGTSAFSHSLDSFFENAPRNQARKTKQSREPVDAKAAAMILQRWLETRDQRIENS